MSVSLRETSISYISLKTNHVKFWEFFWTKLRISKMFNNQNFVEHILLENMIYLSVLYYMRLMRGWITAPSGAAPCGAYGAHAALPGAKWGGGRGRSLENNSSASCLHVCQDLVIFKLINNKTNFVPSKYVWKNSSSICV